MLAKPGQRGERKRAIRRTQQGLDARLDERGERDRELADAQPADPPRQVLVQRQRGCGLDGQVPGQQRVVAPRHDAVAGLCVVGGSGCAFVAGGGEDAGGDRGAPE